MKRIFSALLLGFLILPSVEAQRRKSDRETDGFKGPFRAVRIETAKLTNKSGKQGEGRHVTTQTWTYDKAGYLTEETIQGSHRLYSYDAKGDRLEKRYQTITLGGWPHDSDFDFQQERAQDGAWLFKWELKYDPDGNRIEEVIHKGARGPYKKFAYSYDAKGNRTGVTLYDFKGLVTLRRISVFDDNGNLTEQNEYESVAQQVSKRSNGFEFDKSGNWTKTITSKRITKKGTSFFEPIEVTYRIITYY